MTLIDWLLWGSILFLWSRDVGMPMRLSSVVIGALLLIALLTAILHVLN